MSCLLHQIAHLPHVHPGLERNARAARVAVDRPPISELIGWHGFSIATWTHFLSHKVISSFNLQSTNLFGSNIWHQLVESKSSHSAGYWTHLPKFVWSKGSWLLPSSNQNTCRLVVNLLLYFVQVLCVVERWRSVYYSTCAGRAQVCLLHRFNA